MKTHVQFWLLAAALLVGGSLIVSAPPVAAEEFPEHHPWVDHLRCYEIHIDEHSFTKTYVVETQFDDGKKCKIRFPAKRFCVEAWKKTHHDPSKSDDPRWNEAGHWLCYKIESCSGEGQWDTAEVEDQFSAKFNHHEPWHVERVKNDYFCTPAKKHSWEPEH